MEGRDTAPRRAPARYPTEEGLSPQGGATPSPRRPTQNRRRPEALQDDDLSNNAWESAEVFYPVESSNHNREEAPPSSPSSRHRGGPSDPTHRAPRPSPSHAQTNESGRGAAAGPSPTPTADDINTVSTSEVQNSLSQRRRSVGVSEGSAAATPAAAAHRVSAELSVSTSLPRIEQGEQSETVHLDQPTRGRHRHHGGNSDQRRQGGSRSRSHSPQTPSLQSDAAESTSGADRSRRSRRTTPAAEGTGGGDERASPSPSSEPFTHRRRGYDRSRDTPAPELSPAAATSPRGPPPAGLRTAAPTPTALASSPSVAVNTAAAVPPNRSGRVATAEERHVRYLFHNRPRVQLTERPLVLTNIVLDRTRWEQPLCYVPFFLPCLRNAYYPVPAQPSMNASIDSDALGVLSPSVAYSAPSGGGGNTNNANSHAANTSTHQDHSEAELEQHQQQPEQPQHSGALSGHEARAPLRSHTGVYAVSVGAARPHTTARTLETTPNRTGGALTLASLNPFRHSRMAVSAEGELLPLSQPRATRGARVGVTRNCSHLLYRTFCVRCGIAAQAEALQADAKLRYAAPVSFPWCTCMGVESKPYESLFWMICLLDVLTLGIPCGCCCYHGLGTALYGWHLRFLVRARYRIYAWTMVDLLTMCCVPGLAVDQQGAEFVLNGTPENTIGLHFMS